VGELKSYLLLKYLRCFVLKRCDYLMKLVGQNRWGRSVENKN